MNRFIRRHLKLGAVALGCAGLGAGASAIANAGASTPAATSHSARHGLTLRALARRTVHGDLVVATPRGFVTVTVDRGTVKSVNGQQLTLLEGTPKATYETVTVTLPTRTRVRDNRQKATLSEVKPGQRATIILAPQRALVVARTPPAR